MKSTLDSLKSVFNEFRRKPSLGAPEIRLLSQDKNVQKRWKVDSQAKHKFRACFHGGREILEGGTTLYLVYMQKIACSRSVWCPSKEVSRKN